MTAPSTRGRVIFSHGLDSGPRANKIVALRPVAEAGGFAGYLDPLNRVLEEGNMAQQWINKHAMGMQVADIVKEAILEAYDQDQDFREARPGGCDEAEAEPR